MSTFVTLGTARAPFRRLLDAVDRLAASGQLPRPVCVQSGHTEFVSSNCLVTKFFSMDEFENQLRAAEIIICQAGGGAILLANAAGKIPVIVPRLPEYGEVVDSHQVANAHALEAAGKAVGVYDVGKLTEAVQRALLMQRGTVPSARRNMLADAIRQDLERWAAGIDGSWPR